MLLCLARPSPSHFARMVPNKTDVKAKYNRLALAPEWTGGTHVTTGQIMLRGSWSWQEQVKKALLDSSRGRVAAQIEPGDFAAHTHGIVVAITGGFAHCNSNCTTNTHTRHRNEGLSPVREATKGSAQCDKEVRGGGGGLLLSFPNNQKPLESEWGPTALPGGKRASKAQRCQGRSAHTGLQAGWFDSENNNNNSNPKEGTLRGEEGGERFGCNIRACLGVPSWPGNSPATAAAKRTAGSRACSWRASGGRGTAPRDWGWRPLGNALDCPAVASVGIAAHRCQSGGFLQSQPERTAKQQAYRNKRTSGTSRHGRRTPWASDRGKPVGRVRAIACGCLGVELRSER